MSFRRMGGPTKKKKHMKKPAWDDSVHDLTVYKATPDEIVLRKESHKSKNHMSVKLEQMRAGDVKKSKNLSGADLQKLAIMKEVLYDQHELQKVLSKSDAMMSVVKDLFGDDPRRAVAFPNVTTAPQAESTSTSLIQQIPDIYTRSEKLSDSVMHQSAINDVDLTDSDEDEIDRPKPISYKSKLNLQHYHQYLQDEERKSDHLNPQTLVSEHLTKAKNPNSNLSDSDIERMKLLQMLLEQKKINPALTDNPQLLGLLLANATGSSDNAASDFQTPPRNVQRQPMVNGSPTSAMNDTQKVKKTKKQTQHTSPEHNTTLSSMTDMRQALKDLESELASYEHQTGRVAKKDENKPESFSGYTVSLVSAVSRLTRYLKETDIRLKTEVTLREQLTQDVFQLRAIIDALAGDLIMTQEEYAKLFSETQRYKETTSTEIASLNKNVLELQTILSSQLPSTTSMNFGRQQNSETQDGGDAVNTSKKSMESRTSTPNAAHSQMQDNEEGAATGAILLSPLVRKTRVSNNNNNATGLASKRQTSLVDVSDLAVSNSSHSSDPPQLTQAPPVMKSISVPRPISLVQSNLPVPFPSKVLTSSTNGTVPTGTTIHNAIQAQRGKMEDDLLARNLQEMSVEDALQDPALQNLMQIQIAELNRQQEEAKQRLRHLLANQKLQQQHLHQQLGPAIDMDNSSLLQQWQLGGEMPGENESVSPPISPISNQSDRPVLRDMENLPQIPMSQGISLTLPKADLDVSDGSLSTPPRRTVVQE